MNPSDISALVYDTFGTLVDWRGSLIAELSAWGKGRGINIDWEAFTDAWRGGYQPAPVALNSSRRALISFFSSGTGSGRS